MLVVPTDPLLSSSNQTTSSTGGGPMGTRDMAPPATGGGLATALHLVVCIQLYSSHGVTSAETGCSSWSCLSSPWPAPSPGTWQVTATGTDTDTASVVCTFMCTFTDTFTCTDVHLCTA